MSWFLYIDYFRYNVIDCKEFYWLFFQGFSYFVLFTLLSVSYRHCRVLHFSYTSSQIKIITIFPYRKSLILGHDAVAYTFHYKSIAYKSSCLQCKSIQIDMRFACMLLLSHSLKIFMNLCMWWILRYYFVIFFLFFKIMKSETGRTSTF